MLCLFPIHLACCFFLLLLFFLFCKFALSRLRRKSLLQIPLKTSLILFFFSQVLSRETSIGVSVLSIGQVLHEKRKELQEIEEMIISYSLCSSLAVSNPSRAIWFESSVAFSLCIQEVSLVMFYLISFISMYFDLFWYIFDDVHYYIIEKSFDGFRPVLMNLDIVFWKGYLEVNFD